MDLTKIRQSKFVKAILHYKDGKVWIYAKPEAYDMSGNALEPFLSEIRSISRDKFIGHDSCARTFNLRRGKAMQIEFVR